MSVLKQKIKVDKKERSLIKINKLIEYKKVFGFSCLIKDERAVDLLEDCGFGGKMLYLSLRSDSKSALKCANDISYFIENNYCLRLPNCRLNWINLWKAIEEIVILNGGYDDLVIESFELRKSTNDTFYVKSVLSFDNDDLEEED